MTTRTEVTMMELRSSPGEYLDRVRMLRETFVITRNGKQIAVLAPVPRIGHPTDADVPITVAPDGTQRIETK